MMNEMADKVVNDIVFEVIYNLCRVSLSVLVVNNRVFRRYTTMIDAYQVTPERNNKKYNILQSIDYVI